MSVMKPSGLALLACVLVAVRVAGDPGPVVIRLGTILPSGTAQHAALQEMGEQWRKASGGVVKLTLYPDGRLGGESEMVRKLRIKQINASLFSAVGLAEIDPGVTGLQLMPLAFESWEAVDHVREKMRRQLEERLRAKGFEVLFWADVGWVRFFTKEAVSRPEDFKRLKIFVWAGDQVQMEMMQSLGYRPVPLETTDILLGLNTGMVNAVPMPPLIALAGQMNIAAPYMLDLKWCPIVGAAVVRRDVWEQIPAEHRVAIRAAADATGVKMRARGRAEDEEAIRVMQQRGLKVTAMSPEIRTEWNKLVAQIYPQLRGTKVPADIFDEVMTNLATFQPPAEPAALAPPPAR
jgi:TRAP-type C4-dicarboxylate transport system substrate-binding protein